MRNDFVHYLSPSGLSFASASRLFLASMQAAEEVKPLVNQRHDTFLKQPRLPSHCPSSFSSGRKTPAYDIHGTEQGQPLSTESTNDPQRPKWISIDVNYTHDKYGREKYVQKNVYARIAAQLCLLFFGLLLFGFLRLLRFFGLGVFLHHGIAQHRARHGAHGHRWHHWHGSKAHPEGSCAGSN